MKLADTQSIALGHASMCPECETITNGPRCPDCGAGDMLCLSRVLNRTSGQCGAYGRAFHADLYAPGYLLAHVSEADVQRAITDWLRAERIPARVVDAGAKQMRASCVGRRGGAGAAQAGFPDIVGTLPGGRALYIEVKAPQWLSISEKTGHQIQAREAGKPSPEQLAFLDSMHAAGACVGIAWSVEDAERIVRGKP